MKAREQDETARVGPTLSASEIGRYTYCARAWWLQRVLGYAPENQEALARGTARHAQHGQLVAASRQGTAWARAFLLLALGLALALAFTWLKPGLF